MSDRFLLNASIISQAIYLIRSQAELNDETPIEMLKSVHAFLLEESEAIP